MVEEDPFPLLKKPVKALKEEELDNSEVSIPLMNWLMLLK